MYSLSTPMAALGVLSLDTVATAPPSVLDDPAVQDVEQWIGGVFQAGGQAEEDDPDPEPVSHGIIFIIFAAIIIVLVVILVIVIIVVAIRDAFQGHQSQQKSTTTPKPKPALPVSSLADDLSKQYGVPASVVQDIIDKNPGLTKDEYALLVQYYKKYGKYPYNVVTVFTGIDQNGKSRIYVITQGDLAHIREHPDQLQNLSDADLIALIQELLQEEPDKVVVNKDKQFVDYYYYDVDVDGKYVTIDIRISTSNPDRIISVFERY